MCCPLLRFVKRRNFFLVEVVAHAIAAGVIDLDFATY